MCQGLLPPSRATYSVKLLAVVTDSYAHCLQARQKQSPAKQLLNLVAVQQHNAMQLSCRVAYAPKHDTVALMALRKQMLLTPMRVCDMVIVHPSSSYM